MKHTHQNQWNKDSWRSYPARQQPVYEDKSRLRLYLEMLEKKSAIVDYSSVQRLKQHLARVHDHQGFVLQSGDCAETFRDCSEEHVVQQIQLLQEMAALLVEDFGGGITKIGRIAGQYAKPRSELFEVVNGMKIPNFRGDIIHDKAFNQEARRPDPRRMHQAHECATQTLNWMDNSKSLSSGNKVFTSHEALLLDYEQSLIRPCVDGFYASSGHLLWVGDRTGKVGEAHVEFLRGIENPVGIKVGPSAKPGEIYSTVQQINPEGELGKVLLITRFGCDQVEASLPKFIDFFKQKKTPVLWVCDPMHGNSKKVSGGIKTRDFSEVLKEAVATRRIHRENDSRLSGLHLESTFEDVTECLGGPQSIAKENLMDRYHSYCDPRLNRVQSIALVKSFARQAYCTVNGSESFTEALP